MQREKISRDACKDAGLLVTKNAFQAGKPNLPIHLENVVLFCLVHQHAGVDCFRQHSFVVDFIKQEIRIDERKSHVF